MEYPFFGMFFFWLNLNHHHNFGVENKRGVWQLMIPIFFVEDDDDDDSANGN